MRRILVLFAAAWLAFPCVLRAQDFTYPFQNPALSEDERLDNAMSLMTVDEKIATIVGQGVPRLGIANPGSTEAIHGIVRGGSNQLPNMGNAQGQNAYVNSLVKEIIPFIEKEYRAIPKADSRAIAGLSMGGGHVWKNWRLYLNTFAQLLFK